MSERQPHGCRCKGELLRPTSAVCAEAIYKDAGSNRSSQAKGGYLRQVVAPILVGARPVAPNPGPRHFVTAALLEQGLPQVPVCGRLAAGVPPGVCNPARQIPRHSALDVLSIGHNSHSAWLFQRRKTGNDRSKFHPIVGRVWFGPRNLSRRGAAAEQTSPTARSRTTETRPIREENHLFQ